MAWLGGSPPGGFSHSIYFALQLFHETILSTYQKFQLVMYLRFWRLGRDMGFDLDYIRQLTSQSTGD